MLHVHEKSQKYRRRYLPQCYLEQGFSVENRTCHTLNGGLHVIKSL